MRLSKLKESKPTDLPVDFPDGDRVNLVYDRAVLTTAFARQRDAIAEKLAACLLSWDVTDDNEQPINPPTKVAPEERAAFWRQQLETMPSDVIAFLYNAIWDDVWAGKARGGGSIGT